MLSLQTLGGLTLLGPIGPVSGPVTQRKRLAMLALLAIAPDRRLSRDKFLAYLWPEGTTERARHQLASAVYEVRKLASDEAIRAVGNELWLNPDVVRVDVAAFEAALGRGDYGGAVALYNGPFLDGFFLRDAAEFEHWVECERERLVGSYARALEELGEKAEAVGDYSAAVEWWRTRAAHDPYDSRVALRLMRALEASGNRAAALQHAAIHERLLHEEFDMEPDPQVAALVDRLRSGCSEARTEPGPGAAAESSVKTPTAAPLTEPEVHGSSLSFAQSPDDGIARKYQRPVPKFAGEHRFRSWRIRQRATALGLVGLGGLASMLATFWLSQPGSRPSAAQRVIVAPFDNRTGEPSLDPIGSLAADWIGQGLAHTAIVDVVLTPPPASPPPRSASDGPGALNNATAFPPATDAMLMVSGAYYRHGDSIQFHAQITDLREQRLLRTLDPVTAAAADPRAAVESIGRRAAAAMAVVLDTRLATIGNLASAPSNYEAYHACLEGLTPFFAADWPTATRHFERSLEMDPTYLFPLLHIGYVRLNMGDVTGADSIVQVLNRSRERMMPFELAVLDLLGAYVAGDPVASYEAARWAAAIGPGSPPNVQWAGEAMRLNRPREAIRVLSEIDPNAAPVGGWPFYWQTLTNAHHALGQHRRELREARRVRRLYPDQPWSLLLEARALAAGGSLRELEEVIAARRSLPDQRPPRLGPMKEMIARELSVHGRRDAARGLIERAIAWYGARPPEEQMEPGFRSQFVLALVAGERLEEAESLVRILAEEDSQNIVYQGMLGLLAAARGSIGDARRISDRLADPGLAHGSGDRLLWRGCIAARLGDLPAALSFLQEAAGRAARFDHTHYCLDPLRSYQPFRDWARPDG